MADHIIADCFTFFQRLSFESKIMIKLRPRRVPGTRNTACVATFNSSEFKEFKELKGECSNSPKRPFAAMALRIRPQRQRPWPLSFELPKTGWSTGNVFGAA